MEYYVVTHKALEIALPQATAVIGVEGYDPGTSGVAVKNVISAALDSETGFGALRAIPATNHLLEGKPDSTPVFTGSYRLFLGSEQIEDWLNPLLQENRCITYDEFSVDWQSILALSIPDDVDILIPSPRLLPDTILGQYMRVHMLEDLMFAVGCAIRNGFLDPVSVPYMLQSNTLIPYGNFAASAKIRKAFNEKLWKTVLDFYKNYYVPRIGYQRRVMDFVFERVVSMALVQMITKEKLRCRACRNIWVTESGEYKATV